jgi:hypothetical protein
MFTLTFYSQKFATIINAKLNARRTFKRRDKGLSDNSIALNG